MRKLLISDSEAKHFENHLKNIEECEEAGDNSMNVFRRFSVEAIILDPHERVCTLFCVGCDKPRGKCSCGCVMTEWRPVGQKTDKPAVGGEGSR